MIPILVEKLERGARDPLKRAKEQLADSGEAALPELSRFVDRHYGERHGMSYLQNALDVLKRIDAVGAREILLRCLEHPGDAIRLSAIQGLQLKHARPEDFDILLAHLDVEIPEQRHQVAVAMHSADAGRAEALYLEWIREDIRPGLHRFVAPMIARSTLPDTAAAAAELFMSAAPSIRSSIAASAAAAGYEEALEFLNSELALDDEGPGHRARRTNATTAAAEARLAEVLSQALATDTDSQIRSIASEALDAGDLVEEGRAALRYGLDDASAGVRASCLAILVADGDEVAIDRALSLLGEQREGLQEGMSALMRRLASDPVVAQRTFERLKSRNELESFLPLAKRGGTLKSLGQIPTAEAARFLLDLAAAHPDERIQGLSAHEWLTIQAANTGAAGRAVLAEEFLACSDPLLRMNLLWAASAARTDDARAFLLEQAESGDLSPVETLFACDRLARLGPAQEMAGRLKRIVNRVEDPEVRVALQCLLWRWY